MTYKLVMRLLLFLLFCLPTCALAADWSALSQPGAVAMMRHALAPGTGDPAGFDIEDCATQRNLDSRGRAQARAIGASLRAAGVRFDRVLTSEWCRCRDTARLLEVGEPVDTPALNSFFADRSTREAQTQATLELIRAAEGPVMMVTHQVNITALTGQSVGSGEVFILRATDEGVEVLDRLRINP
jgi:phosphohistidine phosphatase SixA